MIIKKLIAMLAVVAAFFSGGTTAWADNWLRAESPNFIVYSNARERVTRDYVKQLESFKYLTDTMLGKDSSLTVQAPKFPVYLLKSTEQMKEVRPKFARTVAGVYFTCGEGVSAYSGIIESDKNIADFGLEVLFHEYGHHVMFQHAKLRYPAWYVEGFADYLSTVQFTKGRISVGQSPLSRIYTLSQDRWISFETILDPAYDTLEDKKRRKDEVGKFYAQSWLLTHYMLSDPQRARNMNDYFARLTMGEDSIPAFEAATGLKVNDLAGKLRTYMQRTPYVDIKNTEVPDSDIRIVPLPDHTDQYLLNASLLQTCVPEEQGKAILDDLRTKKATLAHDPNFLLALTRAEILHGTPENVEEDIYKLTQSDPDNYEAHYLMGRLYEAIARKAPPEEYDELISIARGAYMDAYKANKLHAPNLYYLARTFQGERDFPNQSAVNAAFGANRLSPGVFEYAQFAAYVLIIDGKRDEAVMALTPFTGDPHNPEQALRIRKGIEAIQNGKPVEEVMNTLFSSPRASSDDEDMPEADEPDTHTEH
ncbi:hypothetical protein [Asticcacaulis tiandongensis]|uniref:hypothetical protein n=1 Tax=Asticcacaulis tiandongensis TaxID=2565365 RepID=UPI001129FCB1|nr:hypothetical protein [Asticcacaulis tiandongensis]